MSQNNKDNIIKSILPFWTGAVLAIAAIFLAFGDIKGVFSTFLGSVFSLIGLRQLANDQNMILLQKNRSRVFTSFLMRLVIYSVPIILGIKFPNYFKFWVILICLFKSQVIFIIRELIINYKLYKQRMEEDG